MNSLWVPLWLMSVDMVLFSTFSGFSADDVARLRLRISSVSLR